MSRPARSAGLAGLAGMAKVKDAEAERLMIQIAKKEATLARYRANLAALRMLFEDVGRHGAGASAMIALNCAAYRESLMRTMATHEAEMQLHVADLDATRQALTAKAIDCEIWRGERDRHLLGMRRDRDRQEQKVQDELAGRAWWRHAQAVRTRA